MMRTHLIRSMLSFFSMLAFGVMTAGALIVIAPWLSGRSQGSSIGANAPALHMESLLLGVVLGISMAFVARFDWAEVPRRLFTWVLVRERQFFYYALIGVCAGVILFY